MKKNDIETITIENISSDGSGVGHIDGFAVFVPHSAVGDIAEIRLVKMQKNYAFGIIENLIFPSPDRIDNDCAAYPKCGGCGFRHINYRAELASKRDFVRAAVRRIGGLDIDVADTASADKCVRYRNKVQFPVCEQDGALAVGFYAERSHRIVTAADCLLQSGLMNRIARAACAELTKLGVSAYNEETASGTLRHIFLRQSSLTGEVMLCLVLNAGGFPAEQEFAKTITTQFPQLATILINVNRNSTNVIMGERCRTVSGSGFLSDELCGVPVRLSPLSFFQVNPAATKILYDKISELSDIGSGDTLLDLYCGAGTIGLSMARRCKKLIGVEIVSSAVADARSSAEAMDAGNAEFIACDAADAAKMLVQRGEKIDIAVVDPPRKGCDTATLDALLALAPKRIVMVSCNPATLARDLKYLTAAGYSCGTAWPVDMFPRTKHVECAVLLSKIQ